MDKVAYFGIPGSYSYEAAKKYFKSSQDLVSGKKFSDVFDLVKSGEVSYGVVPIENSLAGPVYENYTLLSESNAQIVGEIYLKIEHCLLGVNRAGFTVDGIKKVFAHPQALSQCSKFFDQHPLIEQVAYADNASAAKMISQQKDPSFAAIAGQSAGEFYSLSVLMKNLANNPLNYTRFLVVGTQAVEEGVNKCSVCFNLPHVAGSLSNALKVLSDAGMNLTKIESRPIYGRPFEYIFYVDMEFTERYQRGVIGNQFRGAVENLKVLGVYRGGEKIDL